MQRIMPGFACENMHRMIRKVLLLFWEGEDLMQIQYDNG